RAPSRVGPLFPRLQPIAGMQPAPPSVNPTIDAIAHSVDAKHPPPPLALSPVPRRRKNSSRICGNQSAAAPCPSTLPSDVMSFSAIDADKSQFDPKDSPSLPEHPTWLR